MFFSLFQHARVSVENWKIGMICEKVFLKFRYFVTQPACVKNDYKFHSLYEDEMIFEQGHKKISSDSNHKVRFFFHPFTICLALLLLWNIKTNFDPWNKKWRIMLQFTQQSEMKWKFVPLSEAATINKLEKTLFLSLFQIEAFVCEN